MEGSRIDIPTLSLDAVLLAAVAFPAGFSAALASLRAVDTRGSSTPFLVLLTLPFLAIALAVWLIDASRLSIGPLATGLIVAAILAAPVCILLEMVVQRLIMTGSLHGLTQAWAVHGFWPARSPALTYIFVIAIAVGEELVYRHLAYGILLEFGIEAGLAVAATSLLYGLNHLYFGGVTVMSKTLVGVIFAALYLAGDGSFLLPAIAHALQSVLILSMSARRG